jgi:hypothetical protein
MSKAHAQAGLRIFLAAFGVTVFALPSQAEPTHITLRVISKDAKFIGTSMGGVLITIRDAQTGELLAQGTTQGSTGDTGRIMKQDRKRGVPLSTEDAAKFSTTLDLNEPRLVEVTATGPLAQRQSAGRVSATQWIVPGKHLTGGDGWLLEMPGFVVDVVAPPAHVSFGGAPQRVELRANVVMMCGCPTEPGGLWDASRYEVRAMVKRNGTRISDVPFTYAGTTSQFAGVLSADQPGTYEAVVYAYDPHTGNTGLDMTTFIVAK